MLEDAIAVLQMAVAYAKAHREYHVEWARLGHEPAKDSVKSLLLNRAVTNLLAAATPIEV